MRELTFTVSPEEANMIVGGLAELPAKFSMGLINKLQMQASQQQLVPAADQPQPVEAA